MSGSSEEKQLSLPFDQHQRYRIVTAALGLLRKSGERLEVLDVGGAEGVILNFLEEEEVTILDKAEAEDVPGFVQGDATELPFGEGAFDYAVSLDTCEHIAPADRDKYVSELRRVARRGVLLAGPFDAPAVREADELVNELFRVLHGQNIHWLEEHEEHGLPDLGEMRGFFEYAGDSVAVLPNGYLPNWIGMMSLFFYGMRASGEASRLFQNASRFYNRFLYEHDNIEPCYRYLLVAVKDGEVPAEIENLASPPVDREHADLTAALLGSLVSVLPAGAELRRLNFNLVRLKEMLGERDRLLGEKDLALERKNLQVQDLSRKLARQTVRESELQDLRRENRRLNQERNNLNRQLQEVLNARTLRLARLAGGLRQRLGR